MAEVPDDSNGTIRVECLQREGVNESVRVTPYGAVLVSQPHHLLEQLPDDLNLLNRITGLQGQAKDGGPRILVFRHLRGDRYTSIFVYE